MLIITKKSNPQLKNRAAFEALTTIGFDDVSARRALFLLNGLYLTEIETGPVSYGTILNVINGSSDNVPAQEVVSRALGVPRKKLFPKKHRRGAPWPKPRPGARRQGSALDR